MVYNTAKPAPNDNLDVSVTDIQQNFLQANTSFGIDHFPFDNATINNGKHKQSTYPLEVTPATLAGEIALFGSNLIALNPSQLFYTRDASISAFPINGIIDPVDAASGYSFMLGNVLIQWGTATKSTGGTVTFNTPFTKAGVNTNPYNVQTTIFEPGANRHFIYVQSVTFNDFVVTSRDSGGNDESNTFFWMAIGPKS